MAYYRKPKKRKKSRRKNLTDKQRRARIKRDKKVLARKMFKF